MMIAYFLHLIFKWNFPFDDVIISKTWSIYWNENFHVDFKKLIGFGLAVWERAKPKHSFEDSKI